MVRQSRLFIITVNLPILQEDADDGELRNPEGGTLSSDEVVRLLPPVRDAVHMPGEGGWVWKHEPPRGVQWITGQLERGDEGGRIHWQAVVKTTARRTINGLRGLLLETFTHHAHIEVVRGGYKAAMDYVRKDDTRATVLGVAHKWESGEQPDLPGGGQGRRSDLDEVKQMVDDGETELKIAESHFGTYLRYGRGIQRYRQLKWRAQAKANRGKNVQTIIWLWGETGTGKSRAAMDTLPNAFCQPFNYQYWNLYENEEECIMEEASPDGLKKVGAQTLLMWWDRYCMPLNCKMETPVYSNVRRWIITSNLHPDNVFPHDESFAPLKRRLSAIIEVRHGQWEAVRDRCREIFFPDEVVGPSPAVSQVVEEEEEVIEVTQDRSELEARMARMAELCRAATASTEVASYANSQE